MGILTIDQIASVDDLPTKQVEVPAWGGEVVIRQLTKQQQQSMREAAEVDGVVDDNKLELLMIVESMVEPKFTMDQIGILQGKSAEAIDTILLAVYRLSSLDSEAVARKRVEFQEESESVVGVSHSGEVGDDDSPVENGNDD